MKKRNPPLISIVTPCLNRAKYIGEAVESILCQDYPHFEHIIVDGESTDGTLDVLARYPHLRVISEPDRGLYDALNKGVRMARGDIIGWLNSDDLYADGIFHALAHKVTEFPSVEIITGDSDLFVDSLNERHIVRKHTFYSCQELVERRLTGVVSLNGCFFTCGLIETVGLLNSNYRITADHDFLIRLSIYKPVCTSLARVTYHYRQHEDSLTWGRQSKRNTVMVCQELRTIAVEYLSIPDTPCQIRAYCRELYHNSAISLFKCYMEAGSLAEAIKVVQVAQRKSPKFMLTFIKRAVVRGPIWVFRLLLQSIHSGLAKISHRHNNA